MESKTERGEPRANLAGRRRLVTQNNERVQIEVRDRPRRRTWYYKSVQHARPRGLRDGLRGGTAGDAAERKKWIREGRHTAITHLRAGPKNRRTIVHVCIKRAYTICKSGVTGGPWRPLRCPPPRTTPLVPCTIENVTHLTACLLNANCGRRSRLLPWKSAGRLVGAPCPGREVPGFDSSWRRNH